MIGLDHLKLRSSVFVLRVLALAVICQGTQPGLILIVVQLTRVLQALGVLPARGYPLLRFAAVRRPGNRTSLDRHLMAADRDAQGRAQIAVAIESARRREEEVKHGSVFCGLLPRGDGLARVAPNGVGLHGLLRVAGNLKSYHLEGDRFQEFLVVRGDRDLYVADISLDHRRRELDQP